MFSMVGAMFFVYAVVPVNGEATGIADQGQILRDEDGAVVKEHMMVRTQA